MDAEHFEGCLLLYAETVAPKSKGGLRICPVCGSGTGPNKSGAFSLQQDGKRWRCFSCGKGGDLLDLIGLCESIPDFKDQKVRAEELFPDNNMLPASAPKPERMPQIKPEPAQPSFIDEKIIQASLSRYNENNFCRWLCSVFGEQKAFELTAAYQIGTSKYWRGACVFWQVNRTGKISAGKIMLYNSSTGRRVKEPFNHIQWVHKVMKIKPYHLQQCFFGEQLLKVDPQKPVAIVESEKTAVVAAGFPPEYVWLARAGKTNLNKDKLKALQGRRVKLYPDLGAFDKWKEIACGVSGVAVSDILERRASKEDRAGGLDLADYLLRENRGSQSNHKALRS